MELVELGSILHFVKGKKPAIQSETSNDGFLPYVDIAAFESGVVKQYTDGTKCTPCEDGDILIVCDGSRSGLVGRAVKGYVGSTLAKISADGLSNQYLFYFVQGKFALLNTQKKGTGTPHLNPELLRRQKLIVPPLPEQARIVARIEELFSQLDAGVETLKKVKAQLSIYRQAAITDAFDLNGDISFVRLDSIAQIISGITKGRDLSGSETIELPYLRVANVQNGYLDLSQMKTIQLRVDEKEHFLLRFGDVLYTEGGDRDKLGRGTVWRDEIPECVHQNHVFKARIDQKKAIPEYVAYWSMSTPARNYFYQKGKQSVNLASINKTVLSALELPLPSLTVQKAVIESIESSLSVCDSIEQTVDTALQQAEALRQSILKRAFEGGL